MHDWTVFFIPRTRPLLYVSLNFSSGLRFLLSCEADGGSVFSPAGNTKAASQLIKGPFAVPYDSLAPVFRCPPPEQRGKAASSPAVVFLAGFCLSSGTKKGGPEKLSDPPERYPVPLRGRGSGKSRARITVRGRESYFSPASFLRRNSGMKPLTDCMVTMRRMMPSWSCSGMLLGQTLWQPSRPMQPNTPLSSPMRS